MNTVEMALILSAELALAKYSGMNDEQRLAALNETNITAKQPIEKAAIREYLRVTGAWVGLKQSTSAAAILAMDSITEAGAYDSADPVILAALTGVLDGVVADAAVPGFEEPNRNAILAMGEGLVTRLEELSIPSTRLGHVKRARAEA